jgi:hypothetical protein
MTSEVDVPETTWDKDIRIKREVEQDRFEKSVELTERQIEALHELHDKPIYESGPIEQHLAFFNLPEDVQDFKMRELAMHQAVLLHNTTGASMQTVIETCEAIINYIRNGVQ